MLVALFSGTLMDCNVEIGINKVNPVSILKWGNSKNVLRRTSFERGTDDCSNDQNI